MIDIPSASPEDEPTTYLGHVELTSNYCVLLKQGHTKSSA